MKPVYTIQQLEKLKRPQLWEICSQLSLPKYPASAKCIQAILDTQPVKLAAAPQKITTVETSETTIVYADDVPLAAIAYNDDDTHLTHPYCVMCSGVEIHSCSTWQKAYSYIIWHHKQNTLLDKPFDELTPTEWQELKTDDPTDPTDQIETTLEQTEIDSLPDQDFGIMNRLWHQTTLLGTFYRKIFTDTDEWIARPADSIEPYHCPNEDDARYWLVAHNLKLV